MGILGATEGKDTPSQRSIAIRLGIALGLTNALLKRCVRKGWLKVSQAPARRYAYYLTPKGLREKTRLTAEYLTSSLGFYRRARREYAEALETCQKRGWNKIVLVGATELAEIASIAAREAGMEFVAIIDSGRNTDYFFDIPVAQSLDQVEGPDVVIIADTRDPQARFESYAQILGNERVLTPDMLHVLRGSNALADDDGDQDQDERMAAS